MTNRTIRVFLDVDMRCQHVGLLAVATAAKVNLDEMKPGEHVVFINTEMTRIKLYSANKVLSYIAKDKGRIDLSILEEFPNAFGADGNFKFEKAEKDMIVKKLAKKEKANGL